jgi:hypothetical protein
MSSTGNALGSTDSRDFYFNARSLDFAMNDQERDTWRDRFGVQRRTFGFLERSIVGLKSDLASEIGSKLIGFKQTGDDSHVVPIELMLKERVSVLQFPGVDNTGTYDSTDGIQKAILAAGIWRSIYFPYGKYKITGKLYIPRTTSWIIESGSILDCNVGGMVVYFDGYNSNTIGKYDFGSKLNFICPNGRATINLGGENITTGYRGFFSPVHSKDIFVSGIDFTNGRETHIFEFNSCKNVLVQNCGFYGNFPIEYPTVYGYEAIQVDYSVQSGAPSGPPWDGTPCENIMITGNRFDMCHGGVGSHAVNPDRNLPHRRINFIDNVFTRTIYPIKCTNLEESLMFNNRIKSAFQRGMTIDSCKDLIIAQSQIAYAIEQDTDPRLVGSSGGISMVINNYVPNGFDSNNIKIIGNILSGKDYNVGDGAFFNGALYATKGNNIGFIANTIRDANKTAVLFADFTDKITVMDNDFINCGVAGDRDAIRIDTAGVTDPVAYIGRNWIDSAGATFHAIRCISKGTNVVFDRNRFPKTVPMAKRYLPNMFTDAGFTFNDIQNLTNQVDYDVNAFISLPCSVYELETIIIGSGVVSDGSFTTFEGYPFSRASGFRPSDYISYTQINGGVVRIDVIDEFTLKVISLGATGKIRWVKGRKK